MPHPSLVSTTNEARPAAVLIILVPRDQLEHVPISHRRPNAAEALVDDARLAAVEDVVEGQGEPVAGHAGGVSDHLLAWGDVVLGVGVCSVHVHVVVWRWHVRDVGEVGHGSCLDVGEGVLLSRAVDRIPERISLLSVLLDLVLCLTVLLLLTLWCVVSGVLSALARWGLDANEVFAQVSGDDLDIGSCLVAEVNIVDNGIA